MLITNLKTKESLEPLLQGKKIFVINCYGCKEVSFPEAEANEYQKELKEEGKLTGVFTTDYICNPENMKRRLGYYEKQIKEADAILVFSCGVGVQTVADYYEEKPVYAACDTMHLPGVQGVTPLTVDCGQCGECFLNLTGGICPITACSKSLVNGPCGGTKDGMCEVNPEMECGWERIYRKLEALGRLDEFNFPVQMHNFATFEETKEAKHSDVE
jgi:electron transport complex protein RnfC